MSKVCPADLVGPVGPVAGGKREWSKERSHRKPWWKQSRKISPANGNRRNMRQGLRTSGSERVEEERRSKGGRVNKIVAGEDTFWI
ncbi:hypothetical protein ISN45_Aa08g019850 [Arabidopsis thaliana x Arabidopsis arenosa]|uniref:Uncharacterized protein n=1 Tax=Arabidopsis thaliana x Arabidopsis arenosa TaxID=1240361 RepID=A0A8T1XIW9_9BRAS|nr:hypothetical protein ISN45_Aa08g019850 [Arabidopsis thaliana x Arabidopsis arenosa]